MKSLKVVVKCVVPALLVVLGFFSVLAGAGAFPAVGIIPGTDIMISSEGAAAPDVEISANGDFIAVTYFRIDGGGGVHIKSASGSEGWLTSRFLGAGSDPHLSFDPSAAGNNIVYVTWARSDNRAIQYARCTLAAATRPTCTVGIVATSPGNLETPDVVVDSSGNIHVAWITQNGDAQSAVSTDQGGTWSTPVNLASGGDAYRRPQLAFSNGVLHLAYVRESNIPVGGNTVAAGIRIEYRRATTPLSQNWSSAQSFGPGNGVSGVYNSVDHPSLVASGNNVYLAWEAHSGNNSGVNRQFSLMKIESANNGSSFVTPVRYITSDNSAVSAADSPLKESRSSFFGSVVPIQEEGLRPSLVISATSYAAVWQERPSSSCSEGSNATSEIYYSAKGASWSPPDTLANTISQYSIDPDLAINASTKVRHFVFMKDDDQVQGCQGNTGAAYAIYYRGPFIIVEKDEGEDPTDPTSPHPTIYLPIIRK